jgi:hypothetical protein
MTQLITKSILRELARRVSDGIEVTLYWNAITDRLWVFVADERTGEVQEIEAPRDVALDVFNHPYAYAA